MHRTNNLQRKESEAVQYACDSQTSKTPENEKESRKVCSPQDSLGGLSADSPSDEPVLCITKDHRRYGFDRREECDET